MKAQIYINRHIVQANKKASAESGRVVDEAAIAVNTYLGSVYAKEVELAAGCKLIQDAAHARCSGATIWIEVPEFESLVIDGVKATRAMLVKPKQTTVVKEKGEQSMTEFINIEKSADGWVAYDTLLKTSKKFRASSLLNSSLQKLEDHLLVTYEAFGREYLLSH